MDKRTFLKNSAILGLGGAIAGTFPGTVRAAGMVTNGMEDDEYKLPELDYAYEALEPHIDAKTMEIHHSKHHAGYTRKFNAAVKEAGLSETSIMDIFKTASPQPASVRNNGGGYYNHKVFWKSLSPTGGGEPKGELLKAIEKSFGSVEKFRENLSKAAATQFGSGWAWLINTKDGLAVSSTPNQDNPLMDLSMVKGYPLLAIDVWEHAYYLNYQNRRGDYIAAFWNVVNWDYAAHRLDKSKK